MEKGVGKRFQEQLDHFIASVSKSEAPIKDDSLELEIFNYKDDMASNIDDMSASKHLS
jgi:hypothetical protein